MVTIAQGKFSNPRQPRREEPKSPQPVRKKVAPESIKASPEKVEEFLRTNDLSANQQWRDATQVAPNSNWREETQIAPESWTTDPQVTAENWRSETQIVRENGLKDDAQVVSQNWREETRVVPETVRQTPVAPREEWSFGQPPTAQNRTMPGRPAYEPEDDDEYEEESFFDRNKKAILVGGCSAILLVLVIMIFAVSSLLNRDADNGLILNNVIAAGVNIGGMTPEEAKVAIHEATDHTYAQETMVITLPDTIMELTPEDTGVWLNVDKLVDAAYNYGRVGTEEEIQRAKAQALVGQFVMDLTPYMELDAEYIHDTLEAYGESFNSSYLSSSYTFEGEMPELNGDKFDENAPCQTLVLNIGTPGRNLDIEAIYTSVLEAYSTNVFQLDASEAPEEMPEMPDLDQIFEENCSTPIDAYMDMQTFEVIPETYGYTFDLKAAKEKLAESEYGSTIEIPMEYMIPEVLAETLEGKRFGDVLGAYETKHTNDTNRNTNLKLACQAINGYVLNPGDTFSFNDVVGQRTEARGYRKAAAYANGETVSEIGGGVCQVSSTLYYCVLLADLDVTARQNHSYVSSYIPMGMDATVSWGGPEFKFRNDTNYPIRIEAEVSDGYVKVQLVGTDEKDYYVEMDYEVAGYLQPETKYEEFKHDNKEGYKDGDVIEEGSSGYVVKTYKLRYDKETDELLGEYFEATSSYKPHDKVVAKVEPKPTEAPTQAPTEAPTQAPTQAPTEAPTEAPAQAATVAPTEAPTQAASAEADATVPETT